MVANFLEYLGVAAGATLVGIGLAVLSYAAYLGWRANKEIKRVKQRERIIGRLS